MTQDVSKVDQLSEVFHYVKIENDESEKHCELNICETLPLSQLLLTKLLRGWSVSL